ncbi:hypothetical protein IDJ77_22130 [Mucilaginibacter sp. ZT4R22]|uniref:Uncharacterized protein n=1 Tax=Mucilaginibacter pankratovii TaxID=2772110 RepID=A0ABR7WYM2_9SPHI|nr:hypothetical protein [Mucilaginibacter pankratovii]MBD1366529.1 hypothetical protein [Mucilaginibacter pankratovii]
MKSKALLLLFIFLLNTATGFACALRMSIHEHEEATEHHQKGSEATEHGHHGDEAKEHHHEHQQISLPSVHEEPFSSGTYIANNDPCCQAAVNNFNTLAKVTPQSSQIVLLAPLSYIGTYHQFFLKPVTISQANRFLSIDGRRRPPTYPIRIALQSFQI